MFPNASCELNYNNLFELLVAVVLSAQTTDKRVNEVTKVLFQKYNSPISLSQADYNEIYEIVRPLGLAKSKAQNIIQLSKVLNTKYNDIVPNTRVELESLPGVGRKTANAVLMEGFRIPAIAVDTHVSRVSLRLGLSKDDNVLKIEQDLMNLFPKDEWYFVHHGLLFFGRYFCTAKKPNCEICKLKDICTYNK